MKNCRQSALDNNLRAQAEALLRMTRRDVAQLPVDEVQKLVHELQVHQIELEMQNDELRRAQEELETARDQFSELYDFAPIGYVTLDADGVIQQANLAAASMLGVTRKQLVSQKLTRFIAAESQDLFYLHRKKAFTSRRKQACELQFRRQDGTTIFASVAGVTHRNGGHKQRHWLVAFSDQSARKNAEETSARLHLQNELILRSAADGILGLDLRGNHTFVNPAAARMLGYKPKELVGRPSDLICPHTKPEGSPAPKNECGISATYRNGVAHRSATEAFWRKDGTSFPVEYASTPAYEADRLIGAVVTFSDITGRKQMDATLRAREIELATIYDNTPLIMMLVDGACHVRKMNKFAEQFAKKHSGTLCGLYPDEAMCCHHAHESAKSGKLSLHCRNCPILQAVLDTLETGRSHDEEQVNLPVSHRGQAQTLTVLLSTARLKLQGRPHVLVTLLDISAREKAAQQLRRRELELARFFEHAPIGLVWLARNGIILRANQAQLDLLGFAAREFLGRPFEEFCTEPLLDKGLLMARLTADETVRNLRMVGRCKGGATRHLLVDACPVWRDGELLYFSLFVRDITKRIQLEREILEISEGESRRIAQDLHDGLGQLLVGAAYLCNGLHRELTARSLPEARPLNQILKVLREGIAQTRSLSRGLHPVKPEPNGLMVALAELVRRTTKLFHIRCHFACPHPILIADNIIATHLYRIAQEAVTNAIKHGKPGRIEVGLSETPNRILIAVKDNGAGISARSRRKLGLGLRIMEYRAGVIGGSLAIQNLAGGGTAVICSIAKSSRLSPSPRYPPRKDQHEASKIQRR